MAKIGERIVEWLGGVTQSALDSERSRAYEAGYYDGNDDPQSGDIAKGGQGYKDANAGQGAVPAIAPDEAYKIAWALLQSNPVAKRTNRIKRDYIIKRGVRPHSDDDDLQAVLDTFWATNKLNTRALEFAGQLFALGEQCFPVFTRQSDGFARLAYFGPNQIERVVAHPENAMEFYAIVLKAQQTTADAWHQSQGKRVYRIVRKAEEGEHKDRWINAEQAEFEPWEAAMLKSFGKSEYDGTMFFYRVNAVSNQARGQSDFLVNADWFDQGDETLFGLGEREQFAGYFAWDVTLEGADDAVVRAKQKELGRKPPKRGSVLVHNEKEQWEMKTPDLKQGGSIDAYKALLTHALGGAGLPISWYGYGDDTNRATAQAQADPTWRTMEADQGTIRGLLMDFCEYARDQAIIAGALTPKSAESEIDLPMPEMTSRDVSRVSQSLATITSALMIAVDAGWMPQEDAIAVLYKVLDELGMDLEPPKDGEMPEPTEGQIADEENLEAWSRSLFARVAPLEVTE